MPNGLSSAALSYLLWGLFPIYFSLLARVAPFEIVVHRTLWSFVFVWSVLLLTRRWQWLAGVVRRPRLLGQFMLSAWLLTGNWLLYIWAVNSGHVLEASLGYFVTPLINVLLGTWVLKERPRRLQWVAVGVASLGVLWLTASIGRPPWIALVIALTFACYGLLRKTAPLGAFEGLALETLAIVPFSLIALATIAARTGGVFADVDAVSAFWLLLSGPITAIPLLLFASGARQVSMATLGALQYVTPSMQFALGVWWFDEPLDPRRLAGFALIWAALVLYSADGVIRVRRARGALQAGA